ncbi:carbamate kinase [Lentzea sp. BCCO 10_0798]|uniref:Carbamate kinase n=1 Tax=Lentzea kristufekii TaxID=3095430 RepID=A0ABU4TW22_9PSEU|nr:carbamate kinase [Lentzea sp. BCCO 10_0798]MDX8052380.1 carbamate kinase [Lentzea sp. BCCO 10_0798]
MRIVVALGGNALLMRGERADASVQLHHVEAAARALAPLAAEHELVVCHGNGPQIGLLALESEADPSLTRPYPLDTLGAETQGMIGYWLAESLRNAGVRKPVLAVITQTVVDAADPAFDAPTKFIGPVYERAQADRLAEQYGWTTAADGPHWRRVVPSPEPVRLVEQESIEQLVAGGTVVVCAGGGGAPVVDNGQLRGVEAVVDKDLTSAGLAIALKADRLVLLTDVPAVMTDYGMPDAEPLRHLDLEELEHLTFPAGSMGPKIEACRRFVQATGSVAAIGALTDAEALVRGDAGTSISQKPVT